MNDLSTAVAVFGKPYALTKSKIGAITRVFEEKYTCDCRALVELFESINQKLLTLNPTAAAFSFLISFTDKTHHDGLRADLIKFDTIATGRLTERIVLKWVAKTTIDGEENDVNLIVRVTNPINPFLYLQAALSKSPNDIDNLEFEMGSTCATVDGTGQIFADETFYLIQNWINSRNKPHLYINLHKTYKKYEWLIDQISGLIFPAMITSIISLLIYKAHNINVQLSLIPIAIISYLIFSSLGRYLNTKMAEWAQKSTIFSMFQLTNGDIDNLAKMCAATKRSGIKLITSASISILLNVIASVIFCAIFKSQ